MTSAEIATPELAQWVSQDAAARDFFAAAYDGPYDPLDALAWAIDPGCTGPSGAVDPATEIPALMERAYQRPDGAGAQEAAQRKLDAIRVDQAANDLALRPALLTALDKISEQPAPGPPRLRRWWLVAAAIATVAVAVGAGIVLTVTAERPLLAVFEREQTDEEALIERDRLVLMNYRRAEGSVRVLAETAHAIYVVYTSETRQAEVAYGSGAICVQVILGDMSAGTCATRVDFRERGLVGGVTGPELSLSFRLDPDGTFEYEESPVG
jgi:hypothetical protein